MDFLTHLQNSIVLFDGAMGTEIQKLHIQDSEWGDYPGCNEILTLSAPDKIAAIHRRYLEAGAHIIETNTFGANRVVLAEYGIEDRTREINAAAARLAVHERDAYTSRYFQGTDTSAQDDEGPVQTPEAPVTPVFVAGSLGPGTKLPSLGQADFDTLHYSYFQQALGLLEGGVDLFIIETAQDLLQIKAAVTAIKDALADQKTQLPLIVSVTVEANGSLLVGSDIHAVTSALIPMDIDVLGINCATGPREMRPHIEELSRQFPGPIFCMPNAGFPEHKEGELVYSLQEEEFADVLTSFVTDFGVDVIGGCCGTGPSFIAELRNRIPRLTKARRPILLGDTETARRTKSALTSLYSRKELDQEPPPFFIGERTNTNGSKKFRNHLLEEDWNSMVAMGKAQVKTGAHALDVCVAYTGRDEQRDMFELVSRLRTSVDLPLVIDSTTPESIETALKLTGGRSLINSINLENGESGAAPVFAFAKRYGAALICLTIDEEGMARTAEKKLEVAERIFRIAVTQYGLRPEDLIFDPLTFTLGSGDEGLRDAGAATLHALRMIKRRMPGVHTVLGVSNISFGLSPHSREVLNSVFLEEALQSGLDLAIVNVKKIIPVFKISDEDMYYALNLIYNRGAEDPLHAYIVHFSEKEGSRIQKGGEEPKNTPEEQIEECVIEGTHAGLIPILDSVLEHTPPSQIINRVLIPAMKQVGALFGDGKIQLPFVLQSAEVMKQAVLYLEPFMEKQSNSPGKSVVLATVRGDVHDIGKNLVDIILSNNGYRVYNLGIKVDIDTILKKARDVQASAIGLSGLLVKSTALMKSNIETMRDQGIQLPVLLGGAALTREFVEKECAPLLEAPVFYCKDAFDGLQAMEEIQKVSDASALGAAAGGAHTDHPDFIDHSNPADHPDPPVPAEAEGDTTVEVPQTDISSHVVPVPTTTEIQSVPFSVRDLLPYINHKRLFRARWGYRRGAGTEQEYLELEQQVIRPEFERIIRWLLESNIAGPTSAFRLLPCNSSEGGVKVFAPQPQTHPQPQPHPQPASGSGQIDTPREFSFDRQGHPPYRSVADYFLPIESNRRDLIGLQIVTLGSGIQHEITRLFNQDNYRDYLHLHGLAVELTEAAADYVQARMQSTLQSPHHQLKNDGKTGSEEMWEPAKRYSFGYPCCPDLKANRTIAELLHAEKMGISFTEDDQMVPEFTTAAFVCFNPQADYFSI